MSINVLLIGGGGREHALAWRLSKSPGLGTLFITHPQNPGLSALGTPVDVPVDARSLFRVKRFCEKNNVSLVVIGPEDPLAEGFADHLSAPGRVVFGPTREGARLEWDKAWAKQLMRGASIPTAEAKAFTIAESARLYLETRVPEDLLLGRLFVEANSQRDPERRRAFIAKRIASDKALSLAFAQAREDLPVVKASGLAKGKGVVVPSSLAEAFDAVERMMVRREFGEAGSTILIEERLEGREASVFALVDGRNIYVLETAQDHKRLRDADEGPNTGGMGAFTPSPIIDEATMGTIQREILVPTVDALRREGIDYRGVIYVGLMLTPAGPKVLEYNARFGDPECQVLLPRLEGDLLDILHATAERRLDEAHVGWLPGASCGVVLASEGYPDKPIIGRTIHGLEEAAEVPGVTIFHSGTEKKASGEIVTAGGRVLCVTAVGATLDEARARSYRAAELIRFEGRHFRTDIGRQGGEGGARGTIERTHSRPFAPAPGE